MTDSDAAPRLRLAEVISALSYALDLTEGQPPGHCLRACILGMHIGGEIGLPADKLHDLYYTLLLKDAGCSSNAARICQLYGSDDLTIKRDIKTVDLQSTVQLGHFLLTHAGMNTGLVEKLKLAMHMIVHGDRLAAEVFQARCERGADIARQLGFSERVAEGIYSLDEHWNGKGRAQGLRGDAVPLASRIALLAQVIDVFHQEGGPELALREIRRRSGRWFDPTLVAAVERLDAQAGFWDALAGGDLEARVEALEPDEFSVALDDDRLDAIAAGFGRVIDAKSPFTAGHSGRVGSFCDVLGKAMGLDEERTRWLRRGGLLHDIGKLGVSNAILDKPGRLDAAEWVDVKKHATYTQEILGRLGPFEELAAVAGAHHERLDGTGYPHGLAADEISLETRIITVADVFDALTAPRPYRDAMEVDEALRILHSMARTAIDPDVLDALIAHLPSLELAGDQPAYRAG